MTERAYTVMTCSTCSGNIIKDYRFAIKQESMAGIPYFIWMCDFCGQHYKEKIKKTIEL